jgi:hypothetical protein
VALPSLKRFLLVCSTAALASCGGGGDSPVPIQLQPKTEALKSALQGPWPDSRVYYAVLDSQAWANLWSERRSFLGCAANPGQAGCSPTDAPAIDFSSVILVGVNLGKQGRFATPDAPLQAFSTDSETLVEYGFVGLQSPAAEASSAFELIPRTALPITFRARP